MKEIVLRVPEPGEIFPREFKMHMVRAYKEFLLGLKSIIEKRIEKIEKIEKDLSEGKNIKRIEVK